MKYTHSLLNNKVSLYAPARCYGIPEDLKDLVNSAHDIGLAVIIDLVYNHLGPDGNYLSCYNPHYFTEKYNTPWGKALNYDLTTTHISAGAKVSVVDANVDSKHARFVRNFAIDNALSWIRDYHFDGARLDATHTIVDYSSPHFLQELVFKCRKAAPGRQIYFFAEDDRNESQLVTRGKYFVTILDHSIRINIYYNRERIGWSLGG
jgi:maltooligosyltrehalose trehalohydrolase